MEMGRSHTSRPDLKLVCALAIWVIAPVYSSLCADDQPLKLLISVEQQSLTAPFPARVTLHLHNGGQKRVWLYHRARAQSKEGATLSVHLEPIPPIGSQQTVTAAEGAVFTNVGLPHPKLVKLEAGGDYEERQTIRLTPATVEGEGGRKTLWGRYRFSVTYSARFSNAEETQRNLGETLWVGEVTSNVIEMELQPPPAAFKGAINGTVNGRENQPFRDAIVSLTDEQERLVNQVLSDPEGRYSFTQLPLGTYWVTARLGDSTVDEAVFRHVELTEAAPVVAMDLPILPQEIYEGKKMLHKPVLFRITDSGGRPAGGVSLEIVWSSGTVLETAKAVSAEDGTVALELIPGSNYITLKRRGCPKQEQRIEVAEGKGVDDFNLQLDCAK